MNRLGVLVLTVSAVSIQVNKLPTLTTFASPVPIQSPDRFHIIRACTAEKVSIIVRKAEV